MPYEHREGSGTLFPNQYKKQDSHPDWRGDAMINGVIMEVSGWTKGERISLAIKKKEPRTAGARQPEQAQQRTAPAPRAQQPRKSEPEEDGLPF